MTAASGMGRTITTPFKGRGAADNLQNRFERLACERFGFNLGGRDHLDAARFNALAGAGRLSLFPE